MHLHDRAVHLLVYYMKLKSRRSVCSFGTLITQKCLCRSKRDLLEMKAVLLKNANFIFTYKTHGLLTGVSKKR